MCVEGGDAVCHRLCLFQSCQLFLCVCGWVGVCIAGLWQCVMLSLVVAECVSVLQLGVLMLCVSVSLAIRHDPSAWLGSSGAVGGEPQ